MGYSIEKITNVSDHFKKRNETSNKATMKRRKQRELKYGRAGIEEARNKAHRGEE